MTLVHNATRRVSGQFRSHIYYRERGYLLYLGDVRRHCRDSLMPVINGPLLRCRVEPFL